MRKALRLRLLISGLLLFLATASCDSDSTSSGAADSWLAVTLQKSLEQSIAEFKIPGAVMMVREPGGTVHTLTAGTADFKTGRPVNSNLHFRVGSVTKTFIATVVLQLCDEGQVDLNDTLDRFLPGIIGNSDIILIRHLLGMNSGLDDYFNNPAWQAAVAENPHRVWRLDELAAYSSPKPGLVPGGDYVDYANINYILLGMVIETVTGKDYRLAVEKRIIEPLALLNTSLPGSYEMSWPYAHGYLWEDERLVDNSTEFDPSWAGPAGNIISTGPDLLTWAGALVDGWSLLPATAAERLANLRQWASRPGWSYGLGIAVHENGLVGHGGDFSGFYTSMACQYKGYWIAVLTNGQNVGGRLKEADALEVVFKAIRDANL